MANIDIKEWQIGDNTYKFKDEEARLTLATKADQSSTYTKTEINNLIVPANTTIQVVSELPSTGSSNTIYRVQGEDSYTDWGWDGTQFVKLAEYNGTNLYDSVGQNTDGAMTQKAVSDFVYDFNIDSWKNKSLITLNGAQIVSSDGAYIIQEASSSATMNNYHRVYHAKFNSGDIVKLIATSQQKSEYSGDPLMYYAFFDSIPAIGKTTDQIKRVDWETETIITVENEGYVAVYAKNLAVTMKFAFTKIEKAVSGFEDDIHAYQSISLGGRVKRNISPSNTISTENYSYCIPVTGGDKYLITSTNGYSHYAFLTAQLPASGSVPFVSGYESRYIFSGYSTKLTIPEGTSYLYLLSSTSSIQDIGVEVKKIVLAKDKLEDDIERLEDQLANIGDGSTYHEDINMENEQFVKYYISTTSGNPIGTWKASKKISGTSIYPGGIFVKVSPNTLYNLSTTVSYITYAILQNTSHTKGSVPNYADDCVKQTLGVNRETEFITPNNANYIFIYTIGTAGVEAVPKLTKITPLVDAISEIKNSINVENSVEESETAIKIRRRIAESTFNTLTPILPTRDSNNWEIPQTIQELNVQKKAKQFATIRWTPRAGEIPCRASASPHVAGTTYTGLPYSSTKEVGKYVGYDISIHTFMTAVNNPYSLLYTEDIASTETNPLGISVWGFEYHGVNCHPYMGIVCSALALYSGGMEIQWTSTEDRWCSEKNLNMVKIYDQSAQGVRIGDIYWKNGHNRVVTGVQRDDNGRVTKVQITESTSPRVEVHTYDAWEFDLKMITDYDFSGEKSDGKGHTKNVALHWGDMVNGNPAVIYRSTELYRNIDYEPSPYVPLDGENLETVVYNDEICTYAGDKASFYVGEKIVLNYDLGNTQPSDWVSIEVFKEGSEGSTLFPLSEIVQGNLPLIEQGHALDLGTELEVGKYKARIVKTGDVGSDKYTYWEVVGSTVNYEYRGNGIYRITWDSTNGIPQEYEICDAKDYIAVHDIISEEDRKRGYIDTNLVKLYQEQHHSTLSFGDSYNLLRIHFKGEYGRVIGKAPFGQQEDGEDPTD